MFFILPKHCEITREGSSFTWKPPETHSVGRNLVTNGCAANSTVAVFTDSSLCAALLGKFTCQDPLGFNLQTLQRHITIQWITGHILRNEIADSLAKRACSENAELLGVPYTAICARIRQVVKNPSNMKERLRSIARTLNI